MGPAGFAKTIFLQNNKKQQRNRALLVGGWVSNPIEQY